VAQRTWREISLIESQKLVLSAEVESEFLRNNCGKPNAEVPNLVAELQRYLRWVSWSSQDWCSELLVDVRPHLE